MGLINIDLFTTLDGVAQAPGGSDEDIEGDFAFGGWQAPRREWAPAAVAVVRERRGRVDLRLPAAGVTRK